MLFSARLYAQYEPDGPAPTIATLIKLHAKDYYNPFLAIKVAIESLIKRQKEASKKFSNCLTGTA